MVVVWLLREGADDNLLLLDSRNGGLGHGYYPRGMGARSQSHLISLPISSYDCFQHLFLILWLFFLLPPSLQTESTKGFIKGVLQSPFKEGGKRNRSIAKEKDGRRREGETAGETSPSRVEVPASNGTKPR